MSKISAFLKAKKSTKKVEVAEPAPETPATKVEAAVAVKEEWTKDVVDVEIVPVAVRKVDGASDFEDEEIELPSSMVKLNFEWGRSAEERKANAGRQQGGEAAAVPEQPKPQASGLGKVFALKKKQVDDWIPLEASGALGKSNPAATTATTAAAAEAHLPSKKRKERRNKQFLLSSAKEGDDKIITLNSKDIWGVIEPWQRSTFLQSSA